MFISVISFGHKKDVPGGCVGGGSESTQWGQDPKQLVKWDSVCKLTSCQLVAMFGRSHSMFYQKPRCVRYYEVKVINLILSRLWTKLVNSHLDLSPKKVLGWDFPGYSQISGFGYLSESNKNGIERLLWGLFFTCQDSDFNPVPSMKVFGALSYISNSL